SVCLADGCHGRLQPVLLAAGSVDGRTGEHVAKTDYDGLWPRAPVGIDCLCHRFCAGGETGQSLRLSCHPCATEYRDCLHAARNVATTTGDAAGRKPSSRKRMLASIAFSGGAKLAFSGVSLPAAGSTCGVLWF